MTKQDKENLIKEIESIEEYYLIGKTEVKERAIDIIRNFDEKKQEPSPIQKEIDELQELMEGKGNDGSFVTPKGLICALKAIKQEIDEKTINN